MMDLSTLSAYCPQCGAVDKCDEDRCCLTCGADLISDAVLEEIVAVVEKAERERNAVKCDAAYYATKHSVPIHGFATALNAGVHDGRLDMAEELAAAIRGGK